MNSSHLSINGLPPAHHLLLFLALFSSWDYGYASKYLLAI